MELIDPSKFKAYKLDFDLTASDSPGVPVEGTYSIEYIERAKNIMETLDNYAKDESYALRDAYLNSKRAIDYQIDTVLHCFGFLEGVKKERYNFPKKINLLNTLGVTAPSILEKVNRIRNEIEHEHKQPTKSEVFEAIDVAELFYYATNRLTRLFITGMIVHLDDEHFELTYLGKRFEIRFQKADYDSLLKKTFLNVLKMGREIMADEEHNELYIPYEVDMENESFLKWFKFLIQMQS